MTIPNFPHSGRPLVLAHRGASAEHPENTLVAFEAAARAGADLVELDVRLTADGVPVVLHDPDLSRTTDRSGPVDAMTLADVKGADASGGRGPRQEVPTLAEVLAALDGSGTGVDVEIKALTGAGRAEGDRLVARVLEVVASVPIAEPILLSSFDLQALERVRRLAPELPTGVLTISAIPPRRALEHALENAHPIVLPEASALLQAGESFVEEAHEAGVAVGTWTVDDEATLHKLFSWRVDAVATNRPALGVAVRDRVVPG